VLVADFAILVALAIVGTCLAHAALPFACAETSSRWRRMAIVHCNRGLRPPIAKAGMNHGPPEVIEKRRVTSLELGYRVL
jgi:hypothetical protein